MSAIAPFRPRTPRLFVAVICGQKNTGKSTFARLLMNHVLCQTLEFDKYTDPDTSSVYLLDIDPGQPEFAPPGQLSLHCITKPVLGPPFTHPMGTDSNGCTTIRAHSIAALSPKEDPEHFLSCALDLLQCYNDLQAHNPGCSLIINCPGWILGVALEITAQVLRASRVTDLVYLSTGSGVITEVIDVLKSAAGSANFYDLSRADQVLPVTRPAVDFRAMQNISYFHQVSKAGTNQSRWTSTPLVERKPWIVTYDEDDAQILAFMSLGEQPNGEFLRTVCEGTLFSVTIIEDENLVEALAAKLQRTDSDKIPYIAADKTGVCPPPDPRKSRTVGLAYLSHIDVDRHTLALQTPIPSAMRAQYLRKTADGQPRILLIRGQYDTPGWAYQEVLHKTQHDERLKHKSDPPTKEDDDLSIPLEVTSEYDEGRESVDEAGPDVPWIKQLRTGERADDRWRVRKDWGQRDKKRKR